MTLTDYLDQIDAASKALRASLAPSVPVPQVAQVQTADALVAALKSGGNIAIAPGVTLTGSYTVSAPGTALSGNGATINGGKSGPALVVPPGVSNVTISDLTLASDVDPVILCGANDTTQTQLAQAPTNITLQRLTIPTHRGRRGIEWNCTGLVQDCVVLDTWDPYGQDSQALAILNSPGSTHVTGGKYQSGSEGILIGGDTMKMAGVYPTDITIENLEISKPLSWQTDGIKRKVKNLLELKTGRHVVARNLVLDGCWQDAQEGWAIVLTPHSCGDIHDVLIDNVRATNCGAAIQLMGLEYDGTPTPAALSGIVVQNSRFTVSKAKYGGRGVFVLATGEPADFTATNNVVVSDGTSCFYYDPGSVLDPVTGVKRTGGPFGRVTLTGNHLVPGIYGLVFAGIANGGASPTGVTSLTVTGNSFADAAAALKKNLPQNSYVDRATWDAAIST